MKRTIKHPDGREETHEGTPDELAAFDRASRPVAPAPLKPLEPLQQPYPSPTIGSWRDRLLHETRCLYAGLPPGVYGLSCPCPAHTTQC